MRTPNMIDIALSRWMVAACALCTLAAAVVGGLVTHEGQWWVIAALFWAVGFVAALDGDGDTRRARKSRAELRYVSVARRHAL